MEICCEGRVSAISGCSHVCVLVGSRLWKYVVKGGFRPFQVAHMYVF